MPHETVPETESGLVAGLSRAELIYALLGMILTLLTVTLDQALSIPAMPRAVAGLNDFARYSWPTTSFLLTTTIAMLVFAKLSDLYGRKWLYLGSTAIFVVSLLLCGTAGFLPVPLDGMNQFIGARGFLGIGNGAILALTFTLVADLFPPSERGRYQGLLSAVTGFAFVVGPGLGGWITDHLSWRWVYYIEVPMGALAIAAIYFRLPDVRPQVMRRSIDWLGIATLCGWIAPLLLALTWVGQSSWSAPRTRVLLIASAALLAVFLVVEKRAIEPLLVLDLFRDRGTVLMSLNFFLMGISLFGVAVYLPLFLQGVLGGSAVQSGIVFVEYTLALMGGNIASGQLLSRTGKYRLLAATGAALSVAGLFLLSRMDTNTSHFELLCNAILAGIGFGTLNPTYEVLVQNAAPRERMGVATGLTQFSRTIGGTIGLAVFGTILLKLYHEHIDALIPAGAPDALTRVFDNPLQLVFARPDLEPFPRVLVASLLDGARSGLLSALHFIFLLGAGVMAVSFVLNLFVSEGPERKESGNKRVLYIKMRGSTGCAGLNLPE
jgi:EmrB/QacA subfamily drug resistance transporter